MSRFNYQARPAESWDKRGKQSGSNFASFILDEFKTFAVKKDNLIRIAPPTWENPSHYGYDIWVHYGVGPDNGSVLCLFKMNKGKCPICEFHAKAEAAGREDASDYKPTRRVLVWLIDRKEEQANPQTKQVFAWAMPWTLDRDISKVCKDKQTGELYQIDHPDAGFDVSFDREGELPNVKYVGIQIARRASAIDDAYLEYIVKNPLPTVLNWRTYDEVNAIFQGEGVAAAPADAPTQAGVASMAAPPPPPPMATAPPPAPVVMTPPPPAPAPVAVAPPPPPPAPFQSQWLESTCAACGQKQYTTPTGVTCSNGHAQDTLPFAQPLPPQQPAAVVNTTPEAPIKSRAAALKDRFTTGVTK